MLFFSMNYTLKFIQKIITKILHDGFLEIKIVTQVILAMRKLELKYLHTF